MDTGLIILAVSVVLTAYAGMHYFLYRKILWVFPRHKKTLIATLVVLGSMFFIATSLSHSGFSHYAIPLTWLSSAWIGYVFIFFAFAGTLDIAIKLVSFSGKGVFPLRTTQSAKAIFSGGMVFLICIAGSISAQQINVLPHTLATKKIPQRITVVQISDLHLGLLSDKEHIQDLVNRINSLHPDIIVSTGDLVDMQLDHLDGFSSTLEKLDARLGKFAVSGNHEAIAGMDKSRAFTERAGFTILSNRGITLDHLINIVGIDDPAAHRQFKTSGEQEKLLLEKFSQDLFTLFLKHQPVVSPETRGMFDLQLSGHTHGGQIFPFSLLTRLFYSAPFGLSEINADSWLYVSKGTGAWGPQMRVLAEPEVSVFYLVPGN